MTPGCGTAETRHFEVDDAEGGVVGQEYEVIQISRLHPEGLGALTAAEGDCVAPYQMPGNSTLALAQDVDIFLAPGALSRLTEDGQSRSFFGNPARWYSATPVEGGMCGLPVYSDFLRRDLCMQLYPHDGVYTGTPCVSDGDCTQYRLYGGVCGGPLSPHECYIDKEHVCMAWSDDLENNAGYNHLNPSWTVAPAFGGPLTVRECHDERDCYYLCDEETGNCIEGTLGTHNAQTQCYSDDGDWLERGNTTVQGHCSAVGADRALEVRSSLYTYLYLAQAGVRGLESTQLLPEVATAPGVGPGCSLGTATLDSRVPPRGTVVLPCSWSSRSCAPLEYYLGANTPANPPLASGGDPYADDRVCRVSLTRVNYLLQHDGVDPDNNVVSDVQDLLGALRSAITQTILPDHMLTSRLVIAGDETDVDEEVCDDITTTHDPHGRARSWAVRGIEDPDESHSCDTDADCGFSGYCIPEGPDQVGHWCQWRGQGLALTRCVDFYDGEGLKVVTGTVLGLADTCRPRTSSEGGDETDLDTCHCLSADECPSGFDCQDTLCTYAGPENETLCEDPCPGDTQCVEEGSDRRISAMASQRWPELPDACTCEYMYLTEEHYGHEVLVSCEGDSTACPVPWECQDVPDQCRYDADCPAALECQAGSCVEVIEGATYITHTAICAPPEDLDCSREGFSDIPMNHCHGSYMVDAHFLGLPLNIVSVGRSPDADPSVASGFRTYWFDSLSQAVPGIRIYLEVPAGTNLAALQMLHDQLPDAEGSVDCGTGAWGLRRAAEEGFSDLVNQFGYDNAMHELSSLPTLQLGEPLPVTVTIGFTQFDTVEFDSGGWADPLERALVPRPNEVRVVVDVSIPLDEADLGIAGVDWDDVNDAIATTMMVEWLGFPLAGPLLGPLVYAITHWILSWDRYSLEVEMTDSLSGQSDELNEASSLVTGQLSSLSDVLEPMLQRTLRLSNDFFPYQGAYNSPGVFDHDTDPAEDDRYVCSIDLSASQDLQFAVASPTASGQPGCGLETWPQGFLYSPGDRCGDGECQPGERDACCLSDCDPPSSFVDFTSCFDTPGFSPCVPSILQPSPCTDFMLQYGLCRDAESSGGQSLDLLEYYACVEATRAYCGDGVCNTDDEWTETYASCPKDCADDREAFPHFCGNGVCEHDVEYSIGEDRDGDGFMDTRPLETCITCEADCGSCGRCGDGTCDVNEDASTCGADCDPECGDGLCTHDEWARSCPEDCPAVCGDGFCGTCDETWPDFIPSAVDCFASCEDARCAGHVACHAAVPVPSGERFGDENCYNGVDDDGDSHVDCDDAECAMYEGCYSADNTTLYTEVYLGCRAHEDATGVCVADCIYTCDDADGALCCGNGVCEDHEDTPTSSRFCPTDCRGYCGDGTCQSAWESSITCPSDCGVLYCGDGWCHAEAGEDCDNCPSDCEIIYDGDGPACDFDDNAPYCGDGVCRRQGDLEDDGLFETGCTCPEDCGNWCEPVCGDGVCSDGDGETSAECPEECRCGDGLCDRSENPEACPQDCTVCGNGICEGFCDVSCTWCIGESWDPEYIACAQAATERAICPSDCRYCGDGLCSGDETVANREIDCAGLCGNGVCDAAETEESCPRDCVASCTDGICEPDENHDMCPDDCRETCGDGYCQWPETYSRCGWDCAETCGNGVADPGETTLSCPYDVGPMWECDGLCVPPFGEACDQTPELDPCECQAHLEDENPTGVHVTCDVDLVWGDAIGEEYAYQGDGVCMLDRGENCDNSPEDCVQDWDWHPGQTYEPTCLAVCGDGECSALGETCEGCPQDCCPGHSYCPDAYCSPLEWTRGTCPRDCDEAAAPCGNGICEPLETLTCPADCP